MSGAHFESEAAERSTATTPASDSAAPDGAPGASRPSSEPDRLLVAAGLVALAVAGLWQLREGLGIGGLDQAAAWSWQVATLALWVGVGLAASLLPAALGRLGRPLPPHTVRAAATTALAAAICAAVVGALQLGRPWVLYWLLPLPNQMSLWPEYGSPVLWAFLLLAAWAITAAVVFALPGRRGTGTAAVGISAAALLVVPSALATSQTRGVAGAIATLTFIAGALAAGLAVIGARMPAATEHDDEAASEPFAGLLRFAGAALGAALALEIVAGLALGGAAARSAVAARLGGPYALAFWLAVVAAVGAPILLTADRRRGGATTLALVVGLGVWLERATRLAAAESRDFLPASWTRVAPDVWDVALLAGSAALFVALARRLAARAPAAAGPAPEAAPAEPLASGAARG